MRKSTVVFSIVLAVTVLGCDRISIQSPVVVKPVSSPSPAPVQLTEKQLAAQKLREKQREMTEKLEAISLGSARQNEDAKNAYYKAKECEHYAKVAGFENLQDSCKFTIDLND